MDAGEGRQVLEALEEALRQCRAHLEDEGWIERHAGHVVKAERAQLEALTSQVDHLRRQLAEGASFVPGSLASPFAGRWEPLPLFEASSAPDDAGNPSPESPPLEEEEGTGGPTSSSAGSLDAETRVALALAIADAVTLGPTKAARRAFADIRRRALSDVPTLRLLAAAVSGVSAPLGRRVWEQLFWLGARPSRPLEAVDPNLPPTPGLTAAHELPSLDDGLTQPQRLLLSVMRELAPATRPPVAAAVVLTEAARLHPSLAPAELHRALVQLSHPLLRHLPLVEARGLTRRRSPAETALEQVRLADVAEAYLSGELALPLLLVNGAEGMGACFPGYTPHEALSAALAVLDGHLDLRRHLPGPDFPTGGVLHGRGPWDLMYSGTATLRLRARLEVQRAAGTPRARVVVSGLPLPLRPGALAVELERLRVDGFLPGVAWVRDESTAEEDEIILELEHLAYAAPTVGVLLASRRLEVRFEARLAVRDGPEEKCFDAAALLRHFVGGRITRARDRRRAELDAHRQRAALAEAVVVALELLEPVQAALRATADDEEGVAALTRFLEGAPAHRTRLPEGLSHDYQHGFTEAQARHLVKLRRLAARSKDQARREWAALLRACREAEASLDSEAAITALVREELRAAEARFTQPRRTGNDWWD